MPKPSIVVRYLPANRAWAVTFGDSLVTLFDKSGPVGTLFPSLAELDTALESVGLQRDRQGFVVIPSA